ncbi:hypothetical protein JCM10207_006248 [Rhodosporidiobolus poonsookiae]
MLSTRTSALRALHQASILPAARLPVSSRFSFSSSSSNSATDHVERAEGTIESAFPSIKGEAPTPLEQRFVDLKRALWNDGLIESWRSVLTALDERTQEIIERGPDVIPQIQYSDLQSGLSPAALKEVKRVGTVVVHGAVEEKEARGWKEQIEAYIQQNRSLARGFPDDNPQIWEIYNSIGQTEARTHPGLLGTQQALLNLFRTSSPTSPVSIGTPISYYDRVRIRLPGDAVFMLGPHVDGGSLERWEDPAFRSCFGEILRGGPLPHVRHDAWNITPRLDARTNLYNGGGQTSVFRLFQGWTAISNTGPGEGTLCVFPDLALASAYIMLRPFFRPRRGREGRLGFDNWEVDLDTSSFPGSVKGKSQELSDATHPHMRLSQTMTSVPRVKPGSQVMWHTDVVHSVEAHHRGTGDSSVLYIGAVPLTPSNASYLLTQRERFERGVPAPDFPGGQGESAFTGRATVKDVHPESGLDGIRALGYAPFEAGEGETEGGKKVIAEANTILGFV